MLAKQESREQEILQDDPKCVVCIDWGLIDSKKKQEIFNKTRNILQDSRTRLLVRNSRSVLEMGLLLIVKRIQKVFEKPKVEIQKFSISLEIFKQD